MLYRRRVSPLAAVVLVCCLSVTLLSGCGLHSGGDTIAFLRANALWAVNADGSNLRMLAKGNIVSMSWSPDHHQYVMRFAGNITPPSPLSLLGVPDAPGELSVGSVNGGSAIQITPSLAGLTRSDAWWNSDGNRLLYRESYGGIGLAGATYVVSQADQPVGIARKAVPENVGLPTLSPDGSRIATVDDHGNIRLGAPGAVGSVVANGAQVTMPGARRPARLLWQPRHDALLYITAGARSSSGLMLLPLGGKPRLLAEVSGLLDLSFSPDGSRLLLRERDGFVVWDVAQPGKPLYAWSENDPAALPWWSPAGGRILVQDSGGWRLVDIAARSIRTLATIKEAQPTNTAGVTSWHPAAGSPWNGEGNRFVFAGDTTMLWQGKPLPAPHGGAAGLYVADPTAGTPTLIDSGADRAPQWSYLDPSTAFLVMA